MNAMGVGLAVLGLAILRPNLAQTPLSIAAQGGIIVDAETGVALWEKSPDRRLYPASTTKILTALLLIEHSSSGTIIRAPQDVQRVGESSAHLMPGEEVTADDLLRMILLRSGNDAAYTAAIHVSGSVKKFAQLMNHRAAELGCISSHFANPHGLHDQSHYTSPRDLATIARAALAEPRFAEVVQLQSGTVNRSKNQRDTIMKNRNVWLGKDPTATGVKTGHTRYAGQCFVGSVTRDGISIITVQMKSPDWLKDQPRMVDWAYANFVSLRIQQLNRFWCRGQVTKSLYSIRSTALAKR